MIHKPSSKEIRRDLDSWSRTLANITTGGDKLQFDPLETEVYKLWCASYLGQKIAGDLSSRHRDSKTLDEVASQIKTEIENKTKENNLNDQSRLAFIQQAANLVSATYMNTRNDPKQFEKIQGTVQSLIGRR